MQQAQVQPAAAAAVQQAVQQQAQEQVQHAQQAQQQAQAGAGSPQQSALASHHTKLDGRPGAADDTAATSATAAPASTVRPRCVKRLSGSPEPAAAATIKAGDRLDTGEEHQPTVAEPSARQAAGAAVPGAAAAAEPATGVGSHLGRQASAGKRGRQARVVDSASEEEEEEEDGR